MTVSSKPKIRRASLSSSSKHISQIQQDAVPLGRSKYETLCVFWERAIDSLLLHLFIFSVCTGCALYRAVYRPPDSTLPSWIDSALVIFSVYNITTMLSTGQLGMRRQYTTTLLMDIAVIAMWTWFPEHYVHIPLLVMFKYLLDMRRMVHKLRLLVCVNKRIYRDGNHHLDLSLVTTRCLAMGLPAEKFIETLYRNPIQDVANFFNTYYPESHIIVNMCDECSYDTSFFYQVALCPTPDHEVPSMRMLLKLCREVELFLEAKKDSVVAFHCKGGKGRTGMVTIVWLLYSRFSKSLVDCLRLTAKARTDAALFGGVKTVTSISQIRILSYFEELFRVNNGKLPSVTRLVTLQSCIIENKDDCAACVTAFKDLWIRLTPHHHTKTWTTFSSKDRGHVHADTGAGADTGTSTGISAGGPKIEWTMCGRPCSDCTGVCESAGTACVIGNWTTGDVSASGTTVASQSSFHLRTDSTDTEQQQPFLSSRGGTTVPADDIQMEGLFEVELCTGKQGKAKVLCAAYLHVDFLEIAQKNIVFKNTEVIELPAGDAATVPHFCSEKLQKTALPVICVPLLASRDLKMKKAASHLEKNLSLVLKFAVVRDHSW
eukprot:Lankesteria_metandrocarpae@DN191_c0_g1_i1.p1